MEWQFWVPIISLFVSLITAAVLIGFSIYSQKRSIRDVSQKLEQSFEETKEAVRDKIKDRVQ